MGNWFVIVVLIGTLWALQMFLAYQQAQAFMAGVKRLRGVGRTAIGVSSMNRMRRRTYAALATDDGVVVDAISLSGLTVWARPRPAEGLRGRDLCGLLDEQEGRDPLVRAAAMAARSLLRPADRGDQDDQDEDGAGARREVGEVSGIG